MHNFISNSKGYFYSPLPQVGEGALLFVALQDGACDAPYDISFSIALSRGAYTPLEGVA